MTKIRSILRLYTQGVSKKTISEKAGATRNTVKKYIRHYIAMNIPLEELDQMSDTELEQLFSIKEQNEPQKRMNDLLDIFPEIEKALKRKGVTKESVWRKYFEAHPDGYRETQFRVMSVSPIICVIADSKSVLSIKADMASGTEPWHVSSKL